MVIFCNKIFKANVYDYVMKRVLFIVLFAIIGIISLSIVSADCNQSLVNTSWSNWENVSCSLDDTMNQSSFFVQYDANNCGLTQPTYFLRYQSIPRCDYCSERIVGPNIIKTPCNTSDIREIVKYYTDENFESCCAVTNNLSSDCSILTNVSYQNVTIGIESCDYCKPNISRLQVGNCTISDNGFFWFVDGNNCYSMTGLNSDKVPDPVSSFCDYCESNITGPFYSAWSSCSEKGIMNRTKYYIDTNYTSCCQITGLSSDCIVDSGGYRNKTEFAFCFVPGFKVSFYSPADGIYSTSRIYFNVSSNDTMDNLKLLKNHNNKTLSNVTLCKNCKSYANLLSFYDGNYSIKLIGFLNENQSDNKTFSFIVDTITPAIKGYGPRNGITNGSNFYITYNEANCLNISLSLYSQNLSSNFIFNCSSGNNVRENFYLNLSSYNGNFVIYYFNISDIVNKSKLSGKTKIKVDTTSPEITNLTYWINENHVLFRMIVKENNFMSVQYMDAGAVYPRWNILCTSLSNKNQCIRRILFENGGHNVTIRALDKAGNSVYQDINFTIT